MASRKRSPAAPRFGRGSRAEKLLFLLEEKIRRAQNQQCKGNFSARQAVASRLRRGFDGQVWRMAAGQFVRLDFASWICGLSLVK